MALPISFPSTTSNFALPLIFTGQAQREFTLNQSLIIIDALLQGGVTASQSTPPASADEGECFRVTAPAANDWIGHEDKIAIRVGGAWHFAVPGKGLRLFDRATGKTIHHDAGWQTASAPAAPSGGSVIDAEAREQLSDLIEELRKIGIFDRSA